MPLLPLVIILCLGIVALTLIMTRRHPCVRATFAALQIGSMAVALVFGSSAAAGARLQVAGFSLSMPPDPASPEVVWGGAFVIGFALFVGVAFMVVWLLDPKR